jgi:hypothetical protein
MGIGDRWCVLGYLFREPLVWGRNRDTRLAVFFRFFAAFVLGLGLCVSTMRAMASSSGGVFDGSLTRSSPHRRAACPPRP